MDLIVLFQMPKVNWKKKAAGVLGRNLHPFHRHWVFSYTRDTSGFNASLDNDDLEECTYKSQIRIVCGSVLLYIGERDMSVTVDLHLPAQVTMVVTHKYGETEPFCFATVGGQRKCSVFPGKELRKNPHAKRFK